MKKIFVFIFFAILVFKTHAQQQESAHWVLSIDTEILDFEERTKIKLQTLDTLKNIVIKTVWYKKKKKISKIEILHYHLKKHPAILTYYLKDNKLIKHTISGVLPKSVEESKLYIFDNIIYFDETKKVFKKSKMQRLIDVNAFHASYVELLKQSYTVKKFSGEESKKEYDRIYQIIEGLLIY